MSDDVELTENEIQCSIEWEGERLDYERFWRDGVPVPTAPPAFEDQEYDDDEPDLSWCPYVRGVGTYGQTPMCRWEPACDV